MAKYLDSNGLTHLIGKIKTALSGKSDVGHTHNNLVNNVSYDTTSRKLQQTKGSTTSDIVTLSKVATSNSYTDLDNKPTIPSVGNGALTVKVNDVSSTGSFTANQSGAGTLSLSVDADDIPFDKTVTTGGTSIADEMNGIDNRITGLDSSKVDKVSGKGLSTNDYTTAEKNKLSGIAAGAEVNQNAFSNVKVGSTTVAADVKTDTLELVASSNITLTPDATNDKVTIAATDTKNTAGSTASTSTLYLIGATSQSANPQTYSNGNLYAIKGELHAVSYNGMGVNTSSNIDLTSDSSGLRIPHGKSYTLGDACEKGVDTSITAGSSSDNLPTTAAVAAYVAAQAAGSATFQGTLGTGTATSTHWTEASLEAASYKKGWYWVVDAAGTYVGEACEIGDMVFCVSDKASVYSADDFAVIQNNIETITTNEIDTIWAAA